MPDKSGTTGVATINGARLAWRMAGSDRSVVLVHAGIFDRRMSDSQFDRYANKYRPIRYDMRRSGESPMIAGSFSHADDPVALLDELDQEHVSQRNRGAP